MKYDLFERLFMATGLLVGFGLVMMGIFGISFLEQITGNHSLHQGFIDLGLIKINIILFYVIVAFVTIGIFWFVGRLIDKAVLSIWGENTYSRIKVVVFIVFSILFGGIGAYIGFILSENLLLKIGAALIGLIGGVIVAFNVVEGKN